MKPLVVAIEDDDAQRMVLEAELRAMADREGFEVAIAADLAEARRVPIGAGPVLVISDAELPDGHGADYISDIDRPGVDAVVMSASITGPRSHQYTLVEKSFNLEGHRAWLRSTVEDWLADVRGPPMTS